MAPPVPTQLPDVLVAKDTWKWVQELTDYPASDGWVLSFAFQGAAMLASQAGWISTDADGRRYDVTIPAAQTGIAAGKYDVMFFATKAGERYTALVVRGVTVQPDYATVASGSQQSFAEKNLAVVEAACLGRLTADMQSYQIMGRAVTKIPIAELFTIRGKLRAEVWRERHPGTLGIPIQLRSTNVTS